MKNNIRKKFINLLLLEIYKFNKHKKVKRGFTIKYSNKLILSIIIAPYPYAYPLSLIKSVIIKR
jgi:hypothetical protein